MLYLLCGGQVNQLNGNTFYIDTAFSSSADDLVRSQTLVAYITVTATGANAILTLSDVGANSTQTKLNLRVAASGTTQLFRFPEYPVLFPNGIRVMTLTNAIATVIIKNPGG